MVILPAEMNHCQKLFSFPGTSLKWSGPSAHLYLLPWYGVVSLSRAALLSQVGNRSSPCSIGPFNLIFGKTVCIVLFSPTRHAHYEGCWYETLQQYSSSVHGYLVRYCLRWRLTFAACGQVF